MLFLLVRLGDERYVLDALQVVEVLPVVNWKTVPQSAPGILGVVNYRGQIVPLLDLAEFIAGTPSQLKMSTRIVLIHYSEERTAQGNASEELSPAPLLGLVAEGATHTFRAALEDFTETGIDTANYLGPVFKDGEGIIQFIDVSKLLTSEVKKQLVGLSSPDH